MNAFVKTVVAVAAAAGAAWLALRWRRDRDNLDDDVALDMWESEGGNPSPPA